MHDLQPYHCTYEFCQDPNRLYGSRQDWLDHESQHTRVWHCQTHAKEFETQLEYIEHLKQNYEEAKTADFSVELLSSVVGPSTKLQRGCPFCPIDVNSLTEMQKHLAFHMERLALLALPRDKGNKDSDKGSNLSYESHEAQQRGRKISVRQDFGDEEYFITHENTSEDDDLINEETRPVPLTEGSLEKNDLPDLKSDIRLPVSFWLHNISTPLPFEYGEYGGSSFKKGAEEGESSYFDAQEINFGAERLPPSPWQHITRTFKLQPPPNPAEVPWRKQKM